MTADRKEKPPVYSSRKWLRSAAVLLAITTVTGCSNLGYYVQSLNGHMAVVNRARPIADVLDDRNTEPAVRQRLTEAQRMRRFASEVLKLPDNSSYTRYSDIGRPYVIWNVVAAPELSLQPRTWCFMITGCISYRGYYRKEHAQELAEQLQQQSWEVNTYGVPAYSTLGKTNWLGGDPILSTFVHYPEGRFAALLFHELAHQVLYVKGDSTFNESFATAVEQLGVQLWLKSRRQQDGAAAWQAFQSSSQRRQSFRQLTLQTRRKLHGIYTSPDHSQQQKRSMKQHAMRSFRQAYAQWKAERDGYSGYDRWVAKANNAHFASLATYDTHVPAFKKMFVQSGEDFEAFYAAVKELAQQPREQRDAFLNGLVARNSSNSSNTDNGNAATAEHPASNGQSGQSGQPKTDTSTDTFNTSASDSGSK